MTNIKKQTSSIVDFIRKIKKEYGKNGVYYINVEKQGKEFSVSFQSDLVLNGECWDVQGLKINQLNIGEYADIISIILESIKNFNLSLVNSEHFINGIGYNEYKEVAK